MKKNFLFVLLSLIIISCKNDDDHRLGLSKRSVIDEREKSQHEIKKLLLENTWSEVDMNIPLAVVSRHLPISENALNIKYNSNEDTYKLKIFKYSNDGFRSEVLKGAYKMSSEGKFLLAEDNISEATPKEIDLKKDERLGHISLSWSSTKGEKQTVKLFKTMTEDQHYGVYESVNDEKHPTQLDQRNLFYNINDFGLNPDVYKIEMSLEGGVKGKNNDNSFGKFIIPENRAQADGSDKTQIYESSFSEKPVMHKEGYISARITPGTFQNIYILDYEADTQMVKALFYTYPNCHKVWLKKK